MSDDPRPARAVIVLGASPKRSRFSNMAIRAYRERGFTVYPVHPRGGAIEGLEVAARVAEVPGPAETLLLYVRPEIGRAALREARARGVRRVFVNPGAGSPELVAEIEALGMEAIEACAILAIGRSPGELDDAAGDALDLP
jgi:predicted CoA-binding protein